MATNIPAPLKTADIQRFIVRAAQVEKAKPAAAYWCYYYVLDKLLNQGLHKTNDECQAYVVSLMDKVEQMKTDHEQDDAMRDDVTGKAYIEEFGLETFMRADNAIRSNKASKHTADTFQAAYTFLDVLHVWPPVDPEIVAKVKFAKFHAVRIMKAIKAGEDPNATNPVPEAEEPVAPMPALDVNDPEVQAIAGLGPSPGAGPEMGPIAGPQTIGESPEQSEFPPQFVDRPPVSPPDAPISLPPYPNEHSSQSTQAMPRHQGAENYYQTAGQHDVSPLPASPSGGYFPQVPPDESIVSPSLPGPPTNRPGAPYDFSAETRSPMHLGPPHPFSNLPNHGSPQPPPNPPAAFRPKDPPLASPVQSYAPPVADVTDEAMTRAQKHARFAISALNFEDVATAVKELRAALADLGAR